MVEHCSGCNLPIVDKYLLKVLDRMWHTNCLQCYECSQQLSEKCYSREGKLYCAKDFYRRYGTKCSGCDEGILPTNLVRRAKDMVFHVECFCCSICMKEIATGDELYHIGGNKFVCKDDYELQLHEIENTDESPKKGDELECEDVSVKEEDVDEDGENGPNGKRRGPRTTIKAKQLEILKAAFSATPKPTRHMREKLAQETGLSMRVIQVWFQNRRSKERRLNNNSLNGNHAGRGKSRRSPRKGSESQDLLEGMVNALFDPQCAFQPQDLLNSTEYFGNRTLYSPCDSSQFDTHQRMQEDLHLMNNMMSSTENGYGNSGAVLRENSNPASHYMKMQAQHSPLQHHNGIQGVATTQESYNGTAYSFPQSNNLHMNTAIAMW